MTSQEATDQLFHAARNGLSKQVKDAIGDLADVNAHDAQQRTPLHWAAALGHDDVVRLLIENGAEVNQRDESNNTPLHFAAYCGHEKAVQLLIEHGGNINAMNDESKTPLDWAIIAGTNGTVAAGHPDMVALLEAAARKPSGHADRVDKGRDADEKRQR